MESLALVVALLFISALLGGPIALALTYLPLETKKSRLFRRAIVTLFAGWGALTALQFAIANVTVFVRIMGAAGVAVSAFALKREYGTKTEN